ASGGRIGLACLPTRRSSDLYDTGVECAVTGGFGYWRIGLDYAFDDTFDMDIMIKRVINPFSIYGDPYSTEADSSDWNTAFVVDRDRKSTRLNYSHVKNSYAV